MKKIIFVTIPMKKRLDTMDYSCNGNISCCYNQPVIFPINAILADKLKEKDEVSVILLKTRTKEQEKNLQSANNVAEFIRELGEITFKLFIRKFCSYRCINFS